MHIKIFHQHILLFKKKKSDRYGKELDGMVEYLRSLKFRNDSRAMDSRVSDNRPLGNFMPNVRLWSTKEIALRRYTPRV